MTEHQPPRALDLGELRAALADAGAPWQQGATSMTALTERERRFRLGVPITPGLTPDRLADETQSAAAAALAAEAGDVGVPTAFDLRAVNGANYTTPVKDQGNCGSCVAFGSVGAIEHVARFTRGTPGLALDLSEAQMFYCHGRAAGATCATGWWPDQAMNAARDKGVTFEDYYPYTAGDQNCTGLNADWPNRVAKVTTWTALTGNAATMKQYISTYGSITACLDVYQDFFSYRSGVYKHVTGSYAGGHCIVLIGYDDAAGCWIGKNSWNTGWGDAGFLRIGYGECRIESYMVCGPQGVTLRAWLPNQQITGLWSNEVDANVWAYGSARGWLKLDGAGGPVTSSAMLAELAAAKAGNRAVGLFEDNGVVKQIYAW
jgi:C1A family cysteine protease